MRQLSFQSSDSWQSPKDVQQDALNSCASASMRFLVAALQASLTALADLVDEERSASLDSSRLVEWDECVAKIADCLDKMKATVTENPGDMAYKLDCYFRAAEILGEEDTRVAAFGRTLLADVRRLTSVGLFDAAAGRPPSVPARPAAWLPSFPRLFARSDVTRAARSIGHSQGPV